MFKKVEVKTTPREKLATGTLSPDEKGAFVVEAVLLLVLVLAVATVIANAFNQNQYLATIISSPWQKIAGMMENGVWLPAEQGRPLHPNNLMRHVTAEGD